MRNKTEKDGAEREITVDNNKKGARQSIEREKGRAFSFASESGLGADRDWVLQKYGSGRGPRKGRKQANPG